MANLYQNNSCFSSGLVRIALFQVQFALLAKKGGDAHDHQKKERTLLIKIVKF